MYSLLPKSTYCEVIYIPLNQHEHLLGICHYKVWFIKTKWNKEDNMLPSHLICYCLTNSMMFLWSHYLCLNWICKYLSRTNVILEVSQDNHLFLYPLSALLDGFLCVSGAFLKALLRWFLTQLDKFHYSKVMNNKKCFQKNVKFRLKPQTKSS